MSVALTVTENQLEAKEDAVLSVNGFHTQDDDDDENVREAEEVIFDGTTQGLGLKICGGCSEDGMQDDGIFIKRILPGKLADIQGGLVEGDQILEVNSVSMEGITYDKAISILRQASASNQMIIVITRDEEAREAFIRLTSDYQTMADSQKTASSFPLKSAVSGQPAMNTDHLNCLHPEDLITGDSNPASSCNSVVGSPASPASPLPFDFRSNPHADLESSLHSLRSVMAQRVDPAARFPVAKMEKMLLPMGLMISTQKHTELLKNIHIDSQGLTSFSDFMHAVKQVFAEELQAVKDSQRSTPLLPPGSPAPLSPTQVNSFPAEGDSSLQAENEMLRSQIESLKEELQEQKHLCQKAEEQVLSLRKESQTAMEESRSLRTKLRLAEQSQEAARKMEQDYEQVVAMLENEISHLRLQISKSDGINEHRRLAVAACQLKKAEQGKKTYEVATNKLLSHLQHVQDVLASETPHSSRVKETDKGDKKKKKSKSTPTLLSETQDVIRTVQTLIEQVPLPFGWEENYTADGVRYYINHLNQTTAWTHPSSNVEHQSITMTTVSSGTARPQPAVDSGKRADATTPPGV